MKTCVIAGASGGIGRATADELSKRGWNLVLGGRNASRLDGLPGTSVTGDIVDAKTCESLFSDIEDGTLAAVYSAGFASFGDSLGYSREDWDKTLDANLTGMFEFCRAAIATMLPRGGGRIVNVLSIASREAFPMSASYVASKYGGLGLTRSLAAEFREKGVLLTAFLPGSTDTPLWAGKDWKPNSSDMLAPKAVGIAIADIIEAPATVSYDEVVLLPPKGIL